MDSRERYNSSEVMLRAMLDGVQNGIWTAMPGAIVSFDATKVTAVVQLSISGSVVQQDGSRKTVNLPVLVDVPVVFPRGGGCTLTFPVAVNDECLVVFASRAIDAWAQSGGVQPASDTRKHDLSDAFAILGPQSQPNKISNISTNTTQLRSNDGSTYVELDAVGQIVNVVAPGGMKFTTPSLHVTGDIVNDGNISTEGYMLIDGNVTVDGTLTATVDVVGGGKSLKTHTHTGVTSGSSTSGPPA